MQVHSESVSTMRKAFLVVLGAVAGATLTIVASNPAGVLALTGARAGTGSYRQLDLFGEVFDRVQAAYVDKPDNTKLIEAAINGMLAGLDPHSSYLDAKSLQEMDIETRGEFGGIGLEVTMTDGLVKVVAPIDDTPAAKAGIMSGDIITHLNDEAIQGLSLNQAVEKMRGPINTRIRLKVMRSGQTKPIDFNLVRERIIVRAVNFRKEREDIGYIRITQFNRQTTDAVKKALSQLSTRIGPDRLKGYVLDLRNNPGGLLDQSISVSSVFLAGGEVASTKGRTKDENQRFFARGGDLTGGKPIIVLINGGSASASEIVAGALQDHKRATVIGTRSFGKGSVQTIIPLGHGHGALRLTTARYFTPSGRSIQAQGITPDIEVLQDVPKDHPDQAEGEASLRGHLKGQGREQIGSQSYVPPDPKADKALILANDLIDGVVVDAAFPPKRNSSASK
jgi:carboxyl-terminal processing protease